MATPIAKLDYSVPRVGGGEVVRRPRKTDAIGASLRETFGGGARLPTDWLVMLDKLDRLN